MSLESKVEQLRDIFTGRFTYDDDEEWLDNIAVSLLEVCTEVGVENEELISICEELK